MTHMSAKEFLEELGIKGGVIEQFEEEEIKTVGDLMELSE